MREAHLRDFIAVVEAGSVRAAARRLGISESAISKNLSALERGMGVQLLSRSAHGAELTAAGKLVLRRARVVDAELRTLDAELSMLAGGNADHVTIGISSTAEALLLAPAVTAFRAASPHARISIISGAPSSLTGALREGRVQFIVCPPMSDMLGPDLESVRLLSTDQIVVARSGHPLSASPTLEDLARYDWVLGARDSEAARLLREAYGAAGIPAPDFPVQRDSFNALIQLLLKSDFIAIVSRPTVEIYLEHGLLRLIPALIDLGSMVQHLIFSAARPLPESAALLANEFKRASHAHRR